MVINHLLTGMILQVGGGGVRWLVFGGAWWFFLDWILFLGGMSGGEVGRACW